MSQVHYTYVLQSEVISNNAIISPYIRRLWFTSNSHLYNYLECLHNKNQQLLLSDSALCYYDIDNLLKISEKKLYCPFKTCMLILAIYYLPTWCIF